MLRTNVGEHFGEEMMQADPAPDALVQASRNYDPVAVIRGPEGILVVVQVGMRNSKGFMVLMKMPSLHGTMNPSTAFQTLRGRS